MEIERKFIPNSLPKNLQQYPYNHIEQAYLCTEPVIRIRRQNDEFSLTYKGSGLMVREEQNLPLTKESYYHLLQKADGNVISKIRYFIPLDRNQTAELDIFKGKFEGLLLVEVEFNSIQDAETFQKPEWFGTDVTHDKRYQNSYLSQL